MTVAPKPLDLAVWYIPFPPRKALRINVRNLGEAVAVLGTLEAVTAYETVHGIRKEVPSQAGVVRWEPDGDGGWEWTDVGDHELDDVAAQLAA